MAKKYAQTTHFRKEKQAQTTHPRNEKVRPRDKDQDEKKKFIHLERIMANGSRDILHL